MSGEREDRKEGILSKAVGIIILLAGAVGVFYAAYKVSFVSVDYGIHVGIARDLDWSDPVRMLREHPEPVWHILVHALMNVTGFSAEKAAGLVSGGLCALTCLLAAHFLYHPVSMTGRRRKMASSETGGISGPSSESTPDSPVPEKETAAAAAGKRRGKRPRTGRITLPGAALAATALSFAAAIYVPWFNRTPYLGQGSPNPWHNPTTLIVRPIGLLIVMIVMGECLRVQRGGFRKKKGLRLWKGILIAVLLLLSNLSKPSFVQIFYPAIFLLMFLWLFVYRGRNFPLAMQLLVCCLPSCALMGAQFFSAFYSGSNSDAAGVVFAPFKVAGLYTDNIAISTLLVMAFPLLTCLFSIFRRTFDWTDFFAWLLVLVGMAEKFLLAESGSRMTHGNFNWGYILGLYFIWFSGIRLFALWAHSLDEGPGGARKAVSILAFALCGAVLALHLLSGIYYLYYLIVLGNGI